MRFFKAGALAALFASQVSTATPQVRELPFLVYENQFLQGPLEDVVYRTDSVTLARNPHAVPSDFRDLYFAHLPFSLTQSDIEGLLPADASLAFFSHRGLAVLRLPSADAVAAVSSLLHRSGLPCGALFRLYGDTTAHTLNSEQASSPQPLLSLGQKHQAVTNLVSALNASRLKEHIDALALLPSRFHRSATGQNVAALLAQKYRAVVPEGRSDVQIQIVPHPGLTPQPSLVVRIEGTEKPQEIVVLGSHIDSVNWQDDGLSPGADDNASGTATNLEIFTALMNQGWHPQRTIEIHGYAAEEVGLVGSQDIAKRYRAAAKNVVAVVQFDMNLYRDRAEERKIWFIKNHTNQDFNAQMGRLVDLYVGLPWEVRSLWAGSSDHESWDRQGYVASFPFESPLGYNRLIHTSQDTFDGAGGDAGQSLVYAQLGAAYVAHFAGTL